MVAMTVLEKKKTQNCPFYTELSLYLCQKSVGLFTGSLLFSTGLSDVITR